MTHDISQGKILNFQSFARNDSENRALAAEAKALQSLHGRNPYSEFLLAHGRRPNAEQASAIGKLIGAQVLADDGSKQPPLSKFMKRIRQQARQTYRAKRLQAEQSIDISHAVRALAEVSLANDFSVHDLFLPVDDLAFSTRLRQATKLLIRLAESLHEQTERACRDKEFVGGEEPPTRRERSDIARNG